MKNTVLITGSARGIGRGLAIAYAKKGYNLVIHDIDKEPLDEVCSEIEKLHVNCRTIIGNFNSKTVLDNLSNTAKNEEISILINNAGIPCPNIALDEFSDEKIDQLINTNMISHLKLTSRIYNFFKKRREISKINITILIN